MQKGSWTGYKIYILYQDKFKNKDKKSLRNGISQYSLWRGKRKRNVKEKYAI